MVDAPEARAQQPKPSARSRRREGERPPAPWGSFPLVELVILIALVLMGTGFFIKGSLGSVMILSGLGLAILGGTELSIREHFAGYRSHSSLLAGVVTVIVVTFTFVAVPDDWPFAVPFAVGVVVFGVCFYLFREVFKRRSGGLGFR